ncbi:MAG: ABC transporter permease [Bauldia sp.]
MPKELALGAPRRLATPASIGVAIVVLLPVVAGLVGTLLPSLGLIRGDAGSDHGTPPIFRVLADAQFGRAVLLSLFTGVFSTALAFALAAAFCASAAGRRRSGRFWLVLTPILAAPHAAIAIGVAFLIAPSGWIVRLLSPWLTGWDVPPDVITVGDGAGLALIGTLVIKEFPFIVLMTLSASRQVPVALHLRTASALGYSPQGAWLKIILPQLYRQLRLPVYAVLAYSVSVVDMSLILGPTGPPTLGVLAFRWLVGPNAGAYPLGAAAALLLLGVGVVAIGVWRLGERVLAVVGRRALARGRRGSGAIAARFGRLSGGAAFTMGGAALLAIGIWSVAEVWRFPAPFPSAWSFGTWRTQSSAVGNLVFTTLALAISSTAIALLLVVPWLESTTRHRGQRSRLDAAIVYGPLLIPQIAFMFGLQVFLVRLRIDGTFLSVVWVHVVFVVPYLFIALADPWGSLDPRYERTALALGASRTRVFLKIRLPMLFGPLAVAAAIGFSVSVAQYLPTLFAGGGRISTLTTETIALAASGDRRVISVYAFIQAALPLAAIVAAVTLPRFVAARHTPFARAGKWR